MSGQAVLPVKFFNVKSLHLLPRLSPDRLVKSMAVPGLGVGAPEVVDVVLASTSITASELSRFRKRST